MTQTHLKSIAEHGTWPDASQIPVGPKGYKTPDGLFPRVTHILKVVGTGTDALIKWAANEERKACLEACERVLVTTQRIMSPREFSATVESNLGPARQHQKLVSRAGDIGSAAHALVAWTLRGELGVSRGEKPDVGDNSLWAFMAWEDWWKGSRLRVVRIEQPVWDPVLGYAGTIDAIVDHPDRGIGILDLKTSKGIYDTHHLQVAAYLHACRRWAKAEWAEIVRVPKTVDDPEFEVRPLGKLYDRSVAEDQLLESFRAVLVLWRTLIEK
jgi:hypothetical protein